MPAAVRKEDVDKVQFINAQNYTVDSYEEAWEKIARYNGSQKWPTA